MEAATRMGRAVAAAAALSLLKQAATSLTPPLTSSCISSHLPPAVAQAAASFTFSIIPPVYFSIFSLSQSLPSEPSSPAQAWASEPQLDAAAPAWEARPDTQSVKSALEAWGGYRQECRGREGLVGRRTIEGRKESDRDGDQHEDGEEEEGAG